MSSHNPFSSVKILIICDFFPPDSVGGYERRCKEYIQFLRKRGWNIYVLCCETRNNDLDLDEPPWIYREMASKYPAKSFKMCKEIVEARKAQRIIKKLDPDIIYLWHNFWNSRTVLQVVRLSGKPVLYDVSSSWISSVNNNPGNLYRTIRRKNRQWLGNCLTGLACLGLSPIDGKYRLPSQGRIYFTSKNIQRQVEKEGLKALCYSIIPSGINLTRFNTKNRTSFSNVIRFLYVGRIDHLKGLMTAITALRRFQGNDKLRPWRLDIYGVIQDKVYYNKTAEVVSKYKMNRKVFYHGSVSREKMPDIYRNSDVLLFPVKWNEPWSRTILEAMACGCAVIASRMGGNVYQIDHDKTGWLLEHDDLSAWVSLIGNVLKNPSILRPVIENAIKKVHSEFSIQSSIIKIENLIKDIINSEKTSPLFTN